MGEQGQNVEQQEQDEVDQDVELVDQDVAQVDHDVEQQVEDVGEDGIDCPVQNCGIHLANKRSLNRHLEEVHQQVKYNCPEPGCLAKYSRPDTLRKHREQHGH